VASAAGPPVDAASATSGSVARYAEAPARVADHRHAPHDPHAASQRLLCGGVPPVGLGERVDRAGDERLHGRLRLTTRERGRQHEDRDLQVERDDVGADLLHHVDRLVGRHGLADDPDVALRLERPHEVGPLRQRILHDDDADHRPSRRSTAASSPVSSNALLMM
jgi:hypothetical protein